jgi:hypothetical protein
MLIAIVFVEDKNYMEHGCVGRKWSKRRIGVGARRSRKGLWRMCNL